MRTHFRYLPSTRKLIARLKSEVNAISALCAEVNRRERTPPAQRHPDFVLTQFKAPTVATILCATLAHIRGRIHAGKWDAAGQMEWIAAHLPALRDHQRAMVVEAIDVPAREKARLRDHRERKAAHQRNGIHPIIPADDAMPAIARRCGAI